MARHSQPEPEIFAPRLYLATPVIDDPAAVAALLPKILQSADIAAVLLRLAPADDRTLIKRAKVIAPVAQEAGAAVLIEGHDAIVARAGADGAHFADVASALAALPALKPDRIVGVAGLATRHDAMTVGEAGVDYLMFGEPDAQNHRPSQDAIVERLEWWSEVFELPCVAYAANLDEVRAFTAAGADFILVGDMIWSDSRGPAVAVAEVGETIGSTFKSVHEQNASR